MDGYVQLRRGILEHIDKGLMTYSQAGVYVCILLQADRKTGIWWGCALKLQAHGPVGNDLKAMQRCLAYLQARGYIKCLREHGRRGNYPILINKYLVTDGGLRGKVLNAEKSRDYRHPVYDDYQESVTDDGLTTDRGRTDDRTEDGLRTVLTTDPNNTREERRKTKTSKTAALAFAGDCIRVTVEQDARLAKAFPGIDRQAEYRKADAWPGAHRKRDAYRYVFNWLSRSAESIPARKPVVDTVKQERIAAKIRKLNGWE